jgi:methylmalonyl-CoA mutase N-terminal domain/subunit
MREIEERGGSLACISSGWYARRLSDAAYEQARAVESGERLVVGVNKYAVPPEPIEVFTVDPGVEAEQVAAVKTTRERRDAAAVESALTGLREAAAAGENIVEPSIAAVAAYATVGEIVSVLRDVHGSWTPTADF